MFASLMHLHVWRSTHMFVILSFLILAYELYFYEAQQMTIR